MTLPKYFWHNFDMLTSPQNDIHFDEYYLSFFHTSLDYERALRCVGDQLFSIPIFCTSFWNAFNL